jgi:hypothetical protein
MKKLIYLFLIMGTLYYGIPVFADIITVIKSDGTTTICTPIGTGSTSTVICN